MKQSIESQKMEQRSMRDILEAADKLELKSKPKALSCVATTAVAVVCTCDSVRLIVDGELVFTVLMAPGCLFEIAVPTDQMFELIMEADDVAS